MANIARTLVEPPSVGDGEAPARRLATRPSPAGAAEKRIPLPRPPETLTRIQGVSSRATGMKRTGSTGGLPLRALARPRPRTRLLAAALGEAGLDATTI